VHAWLPGNPYSDMLYRRFQGPLVPQRMTMMAELDAFTRLPVRGRLLWIHSEASYSWGRSGSALEEAFRTYLGALQRWAGKGGKLAWTIHDDGLHLNDPNRDRIEAIRDTLRDIADCVHVHSETAKSLVIRQFGIPAGRIVVAPCPSYIPLYPDSGLAIESDQGRPSRRTLLCFGHVKAYKNYDALADSLEELGPGHFRALTIAGAIGGDLQLPEERYKRVVNLNLELRFIPDELVPRLFADADFQVLPYKESLTSSAATLSMGFGVPVIAPDLGGMRETVPPSNWPLIYSAEDPSGLTNALRLASEMSEVDYGSIADDCRARGLEIHPDRVSQQLVDALFERGLLT